jgi:hypothetical protein
VVTPRRCCVFGSAQLRRQLRITVSVIETSYVGAIGRATQHICKPVRDRLPVGKVDVLDLQCGVMV